MSRRLRTETSGCHFRIVLPFSSRSVKVASSWPCFAPFSLGVRVQLHDSLNGGLSCTLSPVRKLRKERQHIGNFHGRLKREETDPGRREGRGNQVSSIGHREMRAVIAHNATD